MTSKEQSWQFTDDVTVLVCDENIQVPSLLLAMDGI